MISGCFWSSSWPLVVYCISWILAASSRNRFNISNMVYSFLMKMVELKFQFHSPVYSPFVGCDCHGRGFAYLSIECVHVLQCSAYQAILSSYWCDVWESILWIRFSLHQLTIWVTFCGGSALERHRRWLLTPTWKWHWQVLWALLTKQLHKMKFTVMFRLMLAWTPRQRSERQWPLLWTSTRFFNPFSFSTIICVWLYYVPWVYWRPVNCWVFYWMHWKKVHMWCEMII